MTHTFPHHIKIYSHLITRKLLTRARTSLPLCFLYSTKFLFTEKQFLAHPTFLPCSSIARHDRYVCVFMCVRVCFVRGSMIINGCVCVLVPEPAAFITFTRGESFYTGIERHTHMQTHGYTQEDSDNVALFIHYDDHWWCFMDIIRVTHILYLCNAEGYYNYLFNLSAHLIYTHWDINI